MPYNPSSQGIFITPRSCGGNGVIEVVFTPDLIGQKYLFDGRFSGWQIGNSNGYLYLHRRGTISHGYDSTSVTLTNLTTSQTVSRYTANVPHKLVMTGIPAGKVISMIGTRFSIEEFFTGKIHYIKTENFFIGDAWTGQDSELGGLASDLLLQFDRITLETETPSNILPNKFAGYAPTQVTIQPQEGWTIQNGVYTGSTNSTLLLGDQASANSVAGKRIYHRLMKLSFNANLAGNTGQVEWQRPQHSLRHNVPITEGQNEHYIYVRNNTLPRLTLSNTEGVTISNISLTESQDAIIQGGTWIRRS